MANRPRPPLSHSTSSFSMNFLDIDGESRPHTSRTMALTPGLQPKDSSGTIGAGTLNEKPSASTINSTTALHQKRRSEEIPGVPGIPHRFGGPEALPPFPSDDAEKTFPSDTEKASSPPPKPSTSPSDFPDGGLEAWLAVFGAFCCMFVSFGWINAIGIFQEYYQTQLLSDLSPSTISWIVSLESFFMFIGGPFVGYIYDNYGPRWLVLAGSFLHVFGLMMASLGTEYYQLLLAQGVCSPIGASMLFYTSMNSTITWFNRRRALALGIMASGSSLGGVIFPIMITHLLESVGFAWSLRAAAFLMLGLLVVANLTVKSRLPPNKKRLEPMAFVRGLGEAPFALLTLSAFCIFFGLFLPFNYLPLSAISHGMSQDLASYLLPILNAASILGRTLPGYLADHFGRFNVSIVMCGMAGIVVLALWLPATANAPIIVFAALYGFGSGAFITMVAALVAQVSDIKEIGVRTGTVFAFVALAVLCGNPVGGALLDSAGGKYTYLQAFSGSMLLGGTMILTVTRLVVTKGKVWTKM